MERNSATGETGEDTIKATAFEIDLKAPYALEAKALLSEGNPNTNNSTLL